jgi:DNA (cytosine-5)-methyltransferase 1
VSEASPDWFLFENVTGAPDFQIEGYHQQRFMLDLSWFSDYSRRRVFVFGSKSKIMLDPIYKTNGSTLGTAVTGSDERSFESCCQIQGLDEPIHLPFLTLTSKKQVVANAVPLQIGRYVARLINSAVYSGFIEPPQSNFQKSRCACGCGRVTLGRAKTHNSACRKRISRLNVTCQDN